VKSNERSGNSLAFFVNGRPAVKADYVWRNDLNLIAAATQDTIVTENSTKAREQAESAFNRTQTQSMARNRTMSEIDFVAAERDAKTQRLRELRLEKEANEPAKISTPRKTTKR